MGQVKSVEDLSDKLKHLIIDIGNEEALSVVTNAPNVGSRTETKKVIVALVGAEVDGVVITKRTISGIVSQGMLMDSKNMGWSGGAIGNAVLVPDTLMPGDPAPTTRPRVDVGASDVAVQSFLGVDKKAAKEQAKMAAKASRDARKAQKSSKGAALVAETETDTDEGTVAATEDGDDN